MADRVLASEKEKMLAGELYNSFDAELTKECFHAQQLLHAYNHLPTR